MQFTDKYTPKSRKDIVGQKVQLDDIKKKIEGFKPGKKSALLIHGPTGTGKTSAIHALVNELDLELIEVNASDVRNTEGLEQTVGPALKQQSLFNKGKLILIDEIDGLSGTNDRGGIPTIIKFIEETKYPIILTANDIYDQKFNSLRKVCTIVEFKAIAVIDIVGHLKDICKKEQIDFDEDAIASLARASSGDLRAALNDLQNMSSNKKITKKDVEGLSEREREDTIVNALLKIFKTKSPEIALKAFENVDQDIDKIFLWLDENLPKEYTTPEDLAAAYENMSLADVYFGRIRRWQYYRYYVYIYDLLSAGIALSKKEKNPNFVQYGPTTRILKIWMANQRNAKKKSIAAKIAAKTHGSTAKVGQDMPYLSMILKHEKHALEEFGLEEEEITWLKK
jgi:replication factor C large subunit